MTDPAKAESGETTSAPLTWEGTADGLYIAAAGVWTLNRARVLDEAARALPDSTGLQVRFDMAGVERLDTSGAWLLHRCLEQIGERAKAVDRVGVQSGHRLLLDEIGEAASGTAERIGEPLAEPQAPLTRLSAALSGKLQDIGAGTKDFLGFFGLVLITFGRILTGRARLRITPVAYHMEHLWLQAMPIVGFLCFVVGATITYNSANMLQMLRAEVYSVNLIALAMLREVGVVIAAIVMAGRSGSTFTVQIGAMCMRQEVDAMRTSGIDPIEVLVVPRVLAAILAFPLLVFFADIMGLLGGGLASMAGLGIGAELFVKRLAAAINLDMFLAGILKAPILAAAVALVGCYQGLRTGGGASELGQQTTRAVVQAIFFVLLLNAMFSLLFSQLGL